MVKSEEEPLTVNVGQVIGIDHALFAFRLSRLAIDDFELTPSGGGFCELVEDTEVQDGFSAGAKGDRALQVGNVNGDGFRERLPHLVDGADERFFESGSAI